MWGVDMGNSHANISLPPCQASQLGLIHSPSEPQFSFSFQFLEYCMIQTLQFLITPQKIDKDNSRVDISLSPPRPCQASQLGIIHSPNSSALSPLHFYPCYNFLHFPGLKDNVSSFLISSSMSIKQSSMEAVGH